MFFEFPLKYAEIAVHNLSIPKKDPGIFPEWSGIFPEWFGIFPEWFGMDLLLLLLSLSKFFLETLLNCAFPIECVVVLIKNFFSSRNPPLCNHVVVTDCL